MGNAKSIIQILTLASSCAVRWSLATSPSSPFVRFWNSLGELQAAAVISALVLTIGAVVEYRDKLNHLARLALKWICRKSTPYERCVFKKLMIHSVGPLLVVFGIAGELVFESRTFIVEDKQEEEARQTVGSLRQEADEADQKAKAAISDSSIALTKAEGALSKSEAAEASLGKAEAEAKGAQIAASNALTLASSARKEADSFERARVRLERKIADRILSGEQQTRIKSALEAASLGGQHATVVWYSENFEAARFASQIESAIGAAHWVTRLGPTNPGVNVGVLPVVSGVLIMTEPPDRSKKAGDVLFKALRNEDVAVNVMPFERGTVTPMYLKSTDPEDSRILVIVGSHP
jgi:hypothetical protein